MKDYYTAYINKKTENSLETKVSKVSKVCSEDETNTFDTFDTEYSKANPKDSYLEKLLLSDSDLCCQFEFEVEERTAIMLLENNLPESEAQEIAREATFQIWMNLFTESN